MTKTEVSIVFGLSATDKRTGYIATRPPVSGDVISQFDKDQSGMTRNVTVERQDATEVELAINNHDTEMTVEWMHMAAKEFAALAERLGHAVVLHDEYVDIAGQESIFDMYAVQHRNNIQTTRL